MGSMTRAGTLGLSSWVCPTTRRHLQSLPFVSGGFRSVRSTIQRPSVGQGHRIKIGGLERMANPAFGKNLSFCGTSSRVFTRFVVALVIVNKYNLYVQYLVIIENLRQLREKRRGGPEALADRGGWRRIERNSELAVESGTASIGGRISSHHCCIPYPAGSFEVESDRSSDVQPDQ